MQDRRSAFRMRSLPERGQVVLRLPDQDLVVKLQDESARGLSVVLRPGTAIRANDLVQIGTPGGWFEAKVVQLKTVDEGLRVGLERGQEIIASARSRVAPWWIIAGAAVVGLVAGSATWFFSRPEDDTAPAVAKSTQPAQLNAKSVTTPTPSP